MAQTITKINRVNILNALDTYNYTVQSSGVFKVALSLTEQPPSGVSILIKKNGSTVASLSAPAASQEIMSIEFPISCASNDVISVVTSSASASDKQLNVLRMTLNILASAS